MVSRLVKLALTFTIGIGAGILLTTRKMIKVLGLLQGNAKKDRVNCHILSQWMLAQVSGKRIGDYLWDKGYRKIAVYGINYMGEILLKELKGCSVQTSYAVDKRAEEIEADVDILKPDDELPEVDALIVTTSLHFEEIKLSMGGKMQCPIISLEEIINDLLSN